MKKILAVLFLTAFIVSDGSAQKTDKKRPSAIGFSFILNDYVTAERIRNSSVVAVLNDKEWGGFRDSYPGISLTYFQGMTNHIDLAVSLSGSFADLNLPNRKRFQGDQFLLEADASAQFKMFPENFTVIPYLSAGLGASHYDGEFGAIVPLGVGLRFNIFGESSLYINSQYRVPLVKDANLYHFQHGIGITGLFGSKKSASAPAQ